MSRPSRTRSVPPPEPDAKRMPPQSLRVVINGPGTGVRSRALARLLLARALAEEQEVPPARPRRPRKTTRE
jgi:hypothetical protein